MGENIIKIGIDGNEANIANRVGVNKYAFEIVWGIYRLINLQERLIVIVYLKDKPLPDMPQETERFKYKILGGGKMWTITKLMPHLFFSKEKLNVLFTPSHYVPLFSPVPRVCAIMDLGYLEFSAQFTKKDYWQLKWWSAWSIKVSKYIITISNATKDDIVRRYPASKDKIVVTYPGADEELVNGGGKDISKGDIEAAKKRYSIVNNYVLYLGTLKPSKNIEGLIDAWKQIVNEFPQMRLVIGGKKGWLYESIFEKVKENGLMDKIIFTGFVDEKDKLALIKGAEVFVIPSFWEGFGLDVLTAFALGVPVVASNAGSLPEVLGNAGILIDPSNTNSIANAIVKILNMKNTEYGRLVLEQREQLKKFSWEKAAIKTLEVLKKA